ncbi:MAG: gas vesicle protein GvpG [Actinobacteria bacterium]|nr:gas vesicle protein GvpG [Actinomycetota bacterium]
MSLLTLPFRLPFLPMQAVVRLAQVIQDEAERTFNDPATIRRELEAIEQARAAGEISDEEAAEWQNEVIARLTRVRVSGAAAADGDEG